SPITYLCYGLLVTAVTVSELVYGPAGVVDGMSSVRLAPNVLVPKPLPLPACTDASTAAVVPRPGLAGVTGAPSVTPVARVLLVGVHPSWLPEMVPPAAVPVPVQSESCPETDQPGKVLRVSCTETALSAPVPVEPSADTVRFTVPVPTVRVNEP